MEKVNFYRLFKYWPRNSGYMAHFKPNNLNAGGSAVCIHESLLQGATVTHLVTCQGRDHIVTIQSGDRNLVVNIHFEPELTSRSVRERLRLITPHWPLCPEAFGVLPSSVPSSLMSSKSLSPTLQGETRLLMVLTHTVQD